MKRTIAVITGGRSDYGLLKPLLKAISLEKDLHLQIIATGMHLSPAFGLTVRDIEADGFRVDVKVKILDDADTGLGIARSMGRAVSGLAQAYAKLKPDMVLGLGDRFELLAAVSAALVNRIPFAHLSGGEISQGAIDDSMRHAITKMSHVHFVANKVYRQRVIQLGEQPRYVFNVGEVGLDQIHTMKFLTKAELEQDLKFKFSKHNLLVTYHPVTVAALGESLQHLKALLSAVDGLKDTTVIFTKANADAEGKGMNAMLQNFVSKRKGRMALFSSLGSRRYLSLAKHVDALVGNSSSGLVEAPSLHVAAINIGDRQKGRLQAANVINCTPNTPAITKAIKRALGADFQKRIKHVKNPYGDGKSSQRIVRVLKNLNLKPILIKEFYDI